jgi:hypothetical protein
VTIALQPAHIPRALVGPPIITPTKGADGAWVVPDGSKLTDEQFASFTSGNLHVNVHSPDHKSGEIRARLKP